MQKYRCLTALILNYRKTTDQVSQILPDFARINNLNKLNVLLHGGELRTDSSEVAKLFQKFLIKTKRFQI